MSLLRPIQVGTGKIAVVSPPVPYENVMNAARAGDGDGNGAGAGDREQYNQPPPDYTEAIQQSEFSDPAIRRGEGGKDGVAA